ncbi:MAG: RagB/SusD family nutrient uptake outer membrane protein [Mediterranea sp.]|jgi:hypothetical protein|nr:RagB/SusD family nutrient uptake outer membrane protein [Mediterranea sp.]
MKTNLYILSILPIAILLGGCDDFLDAMPDNRAEINTDEKITSLLVSAYPNVAPILITEFGSDNVMDSGSQFAVSYKTQEEAYLWESITGINNDDPLEIWQEHYNAIGSANEALAAIEWMGNPQRLSAQRAEALICRAYAHFMLANVFCRSYNPETADKDLGVPYIEKLETQLIVKHTRGTMAELYEKINADIEAALPDIDDNIYSVAKYHFNRKAAYAFAARFNLFYIKPDKSNYQKVIDYANVVLGSNPVDQLRSAMQYTSMGANDIANQYVNANEKANLLIQPVFSLAGRVISGQRRYNHARPIVSNETYWGPGPFGSSGSSAFLISMMYGYEEAVRFPKLQEFFEYTDKTGGIGFAHVVHVPFTTDETLLCRAEAYAMTGKYTEAATDLDYWQHAYCRPAYTANGVTYRLQTLTPERINAFWDNKNMPYSPVVSVLEDGSDRTPKKMLHPRGFTVEPGEQENFIQTVLHYRRITTLHDGSRWYDIKRYGIEVGHNRDGREADILKVDDPRRAIQLPEDVISAGLQANPR